MAATAIAGMATGAAGASGAHSAAGSPLVATALETKNWHHLLNIAGFALGATHGFVTSKNQPFKFLTALATFILVNRHLFLHYPAVSTGLPPSLSVIAGRYSR